MAVDDRLFAYGTLLFPAVFASVTGVARTSRTATLGGYARFRIAREAYPAIVEQIGAVTEGVLIEGINLRLWLQLDGFEGEYYERRSVRVRAAEGFITAQTYVMSPAWRHLLSNEPWSPAWFEEHHYQAYVRPGC